MVSPTPLWAKHNDYRHECWYCGCRLTAPPDGNIPRRETPEPTMRTMDHVVPACNGGQSTVPACFRCNQKKRNLTLDEFRERAPVIFAVQGKPGFKGFWGERREAELQVATQSRRLFNDVMAEKLRIALSG